MRTLKIPYFRQQTGHWCGPAVVQMVLASFGHRTGQRALARRIGTSAAFGTTRSRLAPFIRNAGLPAVLARFGTPADIKREIRRGHPVVVNYFETRDEGDPYGHFSLVVGIDKRVLVLNDPQLGKHHRIPIKEFVPMWNKRKRWMLTVHPR